MSASLISEEKGSKEFQGSPPQVNAFESDLREEEDVFGDETNHEIQYKTLSWQVRLQFTAAPSTQLNILDM